LFKFHRFPASLALLLTFSAAAFAQAPRTFPFRAVNYNVETILDTDSQTINSQATVEFEAEQVAKTVLVELHPDLKISSIHQPGGKPLEFERNNNSPLYLTVGLPEAATPGKKVTLVFEYSGPVSSEEDSPTRGVRFALIDKTAAYLLLPARWFPLTNYPSNRYTGTFKIIVPEAFAVVGTGKSDTPTMLPGLGRGKAQAAYVFRCYRPAPNGSFVAGALQLSPIQAEGYKISVYTPPAQASTAAAYGNSLARMISFFSDAFGPLEEAPVWTIAQMPEESLQSYAAPGFLVIGARNWNANGNDRILSRLAAAQWWGGDRVMPATPADVWLTDGLPRYAEAMYVEQADGVAALHKALEDFAVGAVMFEDTSPISQVQRLQPYSSEYRSVVVDKGALVFHMLRTQLGDAAFTSLLHDFYKRCAGKTASIQDFERMAAAKAPPTPVGQPPLNLTAFFSQWLNSTGVPEFKLEYIVYRTAKGFKVVGKVKQDLDTFRMPVEVKVETEGNPEYKKILVSGTSSDFTIDTFGRPKPNGIVIDPNNNLLKSSPRLRVRAFVARGEALAEVGKYYEAIQEYQRALELAPSNSLAHFRMGEAMFYQKNYQAAANAFRAAVGGDLDPKWVEVWSHIYIGKIWDLLDQRARAVNEYQLAQHTNDDTAGAQAEATKWMKQPYSENPTADAAGAPASASTAAPVPAAAGSQPASGTSASAPADSNPDKPVLKKRPPEK
jgi:aminopeptidase N